MLKKPRRISVLGHEITVTYRKKIKGNVEGLFLSDPLRIYVKSCNNWRNILNHEIFHSILFITGYSQRMTAKEEESLVMALESGWSSLIFIES
jgi:hypothetical protein